MVSNDIVNNSKTKDYIEGIIKKVKETNISQNEFIQAVEEVLPSLEPIIEKNPKYIKSNLLERLCEPERQIIFKVAWTDDKGNVNVNRGFRVQFNGAIGPYKGGLRFHKSVNLGIMKFLGFEQIFKNSLTGLLIGGGKGGSDFDPRGKSDGEIRRFCESFMLELSKHIGPNLDVPAGDIGVGAKEIGYLYGYYRRIRGTFDNGVLTGKGLSYGGSVIRPEATGYGVVYFCNEMLKNFGLSVKEKTFSISGFGNVAWGVCKKVAELGGKVVTLSGPDGYIYDHDGIITEEKINFLLEMRNSGRDKVEDYAKKFNVEFFKGEKPWKVKVDVVIPCATQNDITIDDARDIVNNEIKFLCEAANMPCTNEAMKYMQENDVVIGPAKAANAGGVSVSALEMSQNSMKLSWSKEQVNNKLEEIMVSIHKNVKNTSEKYGFGYDLVRGANIAGFIKVAEAMDEQGLY